MNNAGTCSECGGQLPEGHGVKGLCPRCLLALGLGADDDADPRTIGTYEIERLLGRGGMGVVYKARQVSLNRAVALKVLHPTLSNDPAFVKRFEREAQAVGRLNHQNIVQIYDIGEESGVHFFSMEYVKGKTLREMLDKEGFLKVGQAVDIIYQVARALKYAHAKNIVHRDVKPSNIIIDRLGRVKVMDFGLAKLGGKTRLTKTDTILGTVNYMSPEQARGETVDHRTDIWSMGVVFYEMLAGMSPFKATNEAALIHKIIYESVPDLKNLSPDAPAQLRAIVARAMTRDRDKRYQNVSAFMKDLQEFLTAHKKEKEKPLEKRSRYLDKVLALARTKNALPKLLIPLILVVILIAGFLAYSRWPERSDQSSPGWQLAVNEEFVDNRNSWRVGTGGLDRSMENGIYQLTYVEDRVGGFRGHVTPFRFSDFRLEALLNFQDSSDRAFGGVSFRESRATGTGRLYQLRIKANNMARLQKAWEGEKKGWYPFSEPLSPWVSFPAIIEGQDGYNHISLICLDERITVHINGTLVADIRDSFSRDGDLAFFVGGQKGDTMLVDSVRIYRPSTIGGSLIAKDMPFEKVTIPKQEPEEKSETTPPTPAKITEEAPEGMVLIPAGEFMMGSPSGEGDDDERPQHKVYVDAFYMDKHEVTNAQYKKFVEATSHVTEAEKRGKSWVWTGKWEEMPGANWHHPGGPRSEIGEILGHPVIHVSWDDAIAYARWAGKRLPTEAEWEYACRAGNTTKYFFGNSERGLGEYAWYTSNSSNKTHPAGQKKANAWGLCDMYGNVWEWCSDWYDKDYYRNSPSRNPAGPTNGHSRAIRGGSWRANPAYMRSGNRHIFTPGYTYDLIGFRCAQDS